MREYIFQFFVAIIIAPSITWGQGYYEIKGRVLDTDSIPIPFVHVYIPDVLLGTITNKNGEFKLTIDSKFLKDTLLFSSIGYNTKSLLLNSTNNRYLPIVLEQSKHLLDEVIIKPDYSDSARAIFFKAISMLKKNYSSKLYFLDGFYREVNYKDSLAIRLIEAAIRINSKSYKFDSESLSAKKLKIDIVHIRKSDDYRVYSVWDKVFKLMFGEENNIYKIFQEDYIRYLDKPSWHFLNKDMIEKNYKYKLSDVITDKEDTVYVITSIYKGTIQTRSINFYINKNDFAFTKFEMDVNLNEELDIPESKREKLRAFKSVVLYSKYRNHYYLNFIEVTRFTNGDGFLDSDEMQFSKLQLMVNNVFVKGDSEFGKIRKKEAANQNQNLYNVNQKYDEEFWEDYNMILYAPLKSDIVSDLEGEKTLEKQFRDNN